jgi:hypothetical protein
MKESRLVATATSAAAATAATATRFVTATAAAASTAAATAASTTTATTVSASASGWPIFTLSRFVARDFAICNRCLVETGDCRLGLLRVWHFNECETTRSIRFSINNNADLRYFAKRTECIAKVTFCRFERQISNINIRHYKNPKKSFRNYQKRHATAQWISTRSNSTTMRGNFGWDLRKFYRNKSPSVR